MELKEHLKLAFQTEVQLHVMENEVLTKWKQAEQYALNMSKANNAAIAELENSECNTVKSAEQLKTEVANWRDAVYNEKCAELDNKRLKLFGNETPSKKDADRCLKEAKKYKPSVVDLIGESIVGMLFVLLIESIFLIALFAAYFATGKQHKALLIIPLVLIGIAVLIGLAVGISNFKDRIATNRATIAQYEKYISKYDEENAKYLREKEQLEIECNEARKKELARVMAEREQIINDFNKDKDQRLKVLKEYKEQIDVMVKYANGMMACIEENINNIRNILNTFYEAGFDGGKIHERYRGLIPVGMFYEYVDTERCDTLTGHGGAYNMYEDDCRAARIEQKLDNINDNMFYIGKEIKSAISNVGYAVMGATNLMANKIDAQNLDLQKDISRLRSENSTNINGMLDSLKRDGISVHGTLELK